MKQGRSSNPGPPRRLSHRVRQTGSTPEITGEEYARLDETLPSAEDLARLSREEQQDERYTAVLDKHWQGDFDAVTAAHAIADLREGKRVTLPATPAPVERAPEPTAAEVSADRAQRRARVTAELADLDVTHQFTPGGLLQSVSDADKLYREDILAADEWKVITDSADAWRLPQRHEATE